MQKIDHSTLKWFGHEDRMVEEMLTKEIIGQMVLEYYKKSQVEKEVEG